MELFVEKNSIVRRLWGKSDIIMFIFVGAAAEFALNKAVDWLYYTGRLPSDPLGRLFSTVKYARRIVFSSLEESNKAIDAMRQIHTAVEQNRGAEIPDWAYRDVLFMLIHYSIAACELLEKKMNVKEKNDVYDVFYRVGIRMKLKDLPANYTEWLTVREMHLESNLVKSKFTVDLFKQYKKQLGATRYKILIESQKLIVPGKVKKLLNYNNYSLLAPAIPVYKLSKLIRMEWVFKDMLVPGTYKKWIYALDV